MQYLFHLFFFLILSISAFGQNCYRADTNQKVADLWQKALKLLEEKGIQSTNLSYGNRCAYNVYFDMTWTDSCQIEHQKTMATLIAGSLALYEHNKYGLNLSIPVASQKECKEFSAFLNHQRAYVVVNGTALCHINIPSDIGYKLSSINDKEYSKEKSKKLTGDPRGVKITPITPSKCEKTN